jgi:hydroxyethylthiazole kinase-like uncharacterized protein yjeF
LDSPVVSAAQMRTAEESAFARGISAEDLMEYAGAGIAKAVTRFFPRAGQCIVVAGKGNNAGDAFVAARWLAQAGWKIERRLIFAPEEMGELAQKKLREISDETGNRGSAETIIVLDGLLGVGAKLPLREPIRTACVEINRLRTEHNAFVFAIDLPTGLDADSGAADTDGVIADFTVTIGFAKRGLVADQAIDRVGRIEVVPLGDLGLPENSEAQIATATSLRKLASRRNFSAYKNQCGRLGIVAGSKGLTGAAVLSSFAALRAGAGLVELFVPEEIYPVLAAAAPPEVMVKPVRDDKNLLEEKVDAWAIGPGLGKAHADEILRLIRDAPQPMVIDADALNILAKQIGTLAKCAGPRLLTPHPGEMKRLSPNENLSRLESATKFCATYPITLLLKGGRSLVCEHGRTPSYNSTGNPGMATGGMGDALTGVCGALLARQVPLFEAAQLGAWLCGRAAEIAIFLRRASEESLLPSDLIEHLGAAFEDLRANDG